MKPDLEANLLYENTISPNEKYVENEADADGRGKGEIRLRDCLAGICRNVKRKFLR